MSIHGRPNKAKYSKRTNRGWKILRMGVDRGGRKHVLCDTNGDVPERYVVGKDYNTHKGYWSGGNYFSKFDEAVSFFEMMIEFEVDIPTFASNGDPDHLFKTVDGDTIIDMGISKDGDIVVLTELYSSNTGFSYTVRPDYDIHSGRCRMAHVFNEYDDARSYYEVSIKKRLDPYEFMPYIIRNGSRKKRR